MTVPVTVLLVGLWSLAMLRYGRSVLFPPALLAIVWTTTLTAILLCGDVYFPLTNTANLIVFTGVLSFSFGGICAVAAPLRRGRTMSSVPTARRLQVDRWLNVAGILAFLNIPISYLYFMELSETIPPRESGWRQIRIATSKANISGHNPLSIESVLLPVLTIVALIAVYEYADTGKRMGRALFLVLLAGAYQLLNGARSEVLLLLVSSVVILWIKRGAPPVRLLGTMALAFLLVFTAGQISMGKYGADAKASLTDNLPRVTEAFGTYWLGGIIAFDQNRQNPELRFGWDLGKFAKRIANRFGASYPERDRNLDYTRISPTQVTNVYTTFLPYYMDHGGLRGSIGLMFLVGFLSTYVYRCAIHGSCWAVFTVGAFIYATIMTIFSEEYFAQIMFWIKAGGLATLVYLAPDVRAHLSSRSRNHPDKNTNRKAPRLCA
ncbi:MAG TPA: O-antigen polymerase [Acidobacteriaceae bacterium]|nr:O-antigen polymerase [Acidobacteriaceae bacterium]